MSGIKTVTHKGQVYEIGQIYAFSDEGSLWVVDCLRVIMGNDDHPFKARSSWKLARKALLSDLGTITPAQIELVDGAAYMFYLETTWTGFYRASRKSFFDRLVGGNKICAVTEAADIQALTVESK